MCVCVFVCLAKSGKTGRLCPATLGRGTPRNRQSCRCWGEKMDERMVSPALKPADLLLPVVLLQVRPASPHIQSCNSSVESGGDRWRCRGGDETSCRDHCAEGLRGAGRGFQLTVSPLPGRLGGEHLTAEGHFTCTDRLDYYLSDTWDGCCCGLLQVRTFAITVCLLFICAKWT